MNYLAHGYQYIDNPLKLAGTAVPDWLSVVDRRVRVRSRRILERLPELDDADREVACGILQHLQDDDLFHRAPRFVMLESEMTGWFRELMPDPFDHRPPFLGHIVIELLLDAVISELIPGIVDRYYDALESVTSARIEILVNRLAARETKQLAGFIDRFQAARILEEYSDNSRLLECLNRVLRRVTLPPLDQRSLPVLQAAREKLRRHGPELLETPGLSSAASLSVGRLL